MNVYFLSGIGADHRLFCHISIPANMMIIHLPWISPRSNEPVADFALRMAVSIDKHQPFVLVGLSMGGIIATEIAKIYHPVCTILISSVPLSSNLPPWFQFLSKLQLGKLFPGIFYKIGATAKHLISMRKKEDLLTLIKVIWSGDNRFIRWGIISIPKWKNEVLPYPLYHIHGSRDEIFPIRYTKPTHIIERGGHMLVMHDSEVVNKILENILSKYI